MRLPGLSFLVACLALICGGPVQAGGMKDEPWIFVVHDGDAQPDWQKNSLISDATDEYFYGMMAVMKTWRAGPSGEKAFFEWIADHQRAWNSVEGCFGQPLSTDAMVLSERNFDLGFDWMIGKLGSDAALRQRPVGPRVEKAMIGVDTPGGRANYLTCSKSGVMKVSATGADSANRISVGPATNALVNRMPTFQLSATHELGHVVQNNLSPGKQHDDRDLRAMRNARWIIEGAADAVAVTHTQEHYGSKEYFGPYSDRYYRRFFLSRAYNIPLNHPHKPQPVAGQAKTAQERLLMNIEKKTLDLLDYQTNGFWFHVIERYLGGNPKRLNALYRSMTGDAVAANATGLVDRWLDGIDGGLDGLEHVFPQFLAEYASWPAHRFDGRMPEEKWLKLGFGGCDDLRIAPGAGSASTTLRLAEYAGDCLRLRVNPAAALVRPDVQIRLTGPNQVVDDIYLGWARGNDFKDAPKAADCYEVVESRGRRGGAPCLLTPQDGISAGRYQRFFYLPEIRQAGPREDSEFLLVVSWVPGTIRDARRDFRIEDIELTVALDAASLGAGDPGSSGQPATTDYASKKGRAPVSAEGEKDPGAASMRDIFTGNVATMPGLPPAMAQTVRKQAEGSVTVNLDATDRRGGGGTEVTFFFETPLEPGHVGPLDVFAASVNGDRIGTQNPAQDSSLTIEEYSGESLRFRGVAQVCEGDMAALMSAGKGAELCEIFPPRRYEVTGTIAFPTARNTQGRLAQPPDSEVYRNYQDIRLARIEQRFSIPGEMTGDPGPDDRFGPGNAGTSSGFGRKRQNLAGPGCDCGCESPDRNSGNLQCKLLCGKTWKQCPAP